MERMSHRVVSKSPEHAAFDLELDPDPPAFLSRPPRSLTVSERASSGVTLTCRVRGHPPPAVTWTRHGADLVTGPRYAVTSEGDTHTLHFERPEKEDAGDYECHVRNPAGAVTQTCTLLVTHTTAADCDASDPSGHLKGNSTTSVLTTTDPQPSQTSAMSNTTTTTTTSSLAATSTTSRLSRAASSRGVARSPSWHSSGTSGLAALGRVGGIPIRVGSVRKRRDWFEQRASPSPDHASSSSFSAEISRSPALSLDREIGLEDKGCCFSDVAVIQAVSVSHRTSTLIDQAVSHDFLAPAIYQFKTSSSSVEDADKLKTPSAEQDLSRPEHRHSRSAHVPDENGKPVADTHRVRNINRDDESPQREKVDKNKFERFAEDAQPHRREKRAAEDDADVTVRALSPGRMDFRSVLRRSLRDSPKRQETGWTAERREQAKTDFRSALKKSTARTQTDKIARRLFPEDPKGDTTQTSDGEWIHDDVSQSSDEVNTDSTQTVTGMEASTATETSTKSTRVPQAAIADEPLTQPPESSTIERDLNSTQKFHAPIQGSAFPDTRESTTEEDIHDSRNVEAAEVKAPVKVQGLEDQRVSYGGQVVMRCTVTGHPQPAITWTHNRKEVKPSKYFQVSYQEPYAQLLMSEAYSEDEGEYTCTVTSAACTQPSSSSCYLTVEGENPQGNAHENCKEVSLTSDRKFQDCYECGRELGRGKFGSVLECREKRTGAVRAAKVMKAVGRVRKEEVRREVEVMNALRHHPALPRLWAAFEEDRSVTLVMEHVGGGELLERVSGEQYVLTEGDCAGYVGQLCSGLTFMHRQGVIHLDLKPNNVLCVDQHQHSTRIKIIDFGLARFYTPGDSLHVLFGTPEFVSPEVINYDDISFATDMWSVGVIAYILVSGLSPFLGDDDAETLANVTCGEYDFDDESFDVISEDAKDFISSLLLKRKEKRLSAEQCERHVWLTRRREDDGQESRRLNTDNLRCFVQAHRKRWQKAGQVIIATQRLRKGTSIIQP